MYLNGLSELSKAVRKSMYSDERSIDDNPIAAWL
jgi:hypothetical protein